MLATAVANVDVAIRRQRRAQECEPIAAGDGLHRELSEDVVEDDRPHDLRRGRLPGGVDPREQHLRAVLELWCIRAQAGGRLLAEDVDAVARSRRPARFWTPAGLHARQVERA